MREIKLSLIQMSMGPDPAANLDKAEAMLRRAAAGGARLALLPELFETEYFPKDRGLEVSGLARSAQGDPVLERFRKLAAELDVVLPVSFFERGEDGPYNSLVLFDADGSDLGRYRKAHIPEGPGYEERDYFRPGGTPFLVRDTKYGRIGCAVCWDQWFPEAARAMALEGAELLLYPTAIGSEPHAPELDTAPHWRTVMRGHAGANLCYLAAANRVGRERGESCAIDFYGSSFVAGPFGEVLAEAGRGEEAVLESLIDLDRVAGLREDWGFFRHRRPDLYVGLTTGGKT